MSAATYTFTESDTIDTSGALLSTDDSKMVDLNKAWSAAKHKNWISPVKWPKALERSILMEPKLSDLDPDEVRVVKFVMYKAREIGAVQPVAYDPAPAPVPVLPPVDPSAQPAGSSAVTVQKSFVVKEGKIVREFDVVAFKKSVLSVKAKFKKDELILEALGVVADVDFFALVQEILKEPEAVWLVALLGLRLILPQGVRAEMDKTLAEISALTNRSGVLSQGLVRMGGYIALGCCKDEAVLSKVLGRNPNPLLGQDVTNRPAIRKKGETDADFTARSNLQASNFALYKAVHDGVKVHANSFHNMSPTKKAEIKAELMSYFAV